MNKTTSCVLVAAALALAAPLRADELSTGVALFNQGKYAEAEGHLRAAQGADASAYLAASLDKQKKYAEAEAPARAAVGEVPTHAVGVAALGESLVNQKKYDEAIDRMTAAVNAKADLAYAYYWRAQAENAKKQPDKMVDDFQMFLKLAPKAPEAQSVQQLIAGLR